MPRALGYRPDPPGTIYKSHAHAIRASRISLSSSDLSRYRAGYVYQGRIGSCVHESIKRGIQLASSILGQMFLASDQAGYAIGRKYEARIERPDLEAEQLPKLEDIGDTGAYPNIAMRAWQSVGLVSESLWPGPASGRKDWAAMLETEPPGHVLEKAYDARGLEFVSVDLSRGLRNAVIDMHKSGCPVTLAINADGISNVDPGNGVVQSLPKTGQNHAVLVLSGEDPDYALMDNWWDALDESWGIQYDTQLRGCWRVKWAALEAGCSDVLAITGLPVTLTPKVQP